MKKREFFEFFKRGSLILTVASTVFLVPSLKANIPGQVPRHTGNSSAASPPFGNTYDVLSVEWWLWFFMEPTPDNPVAGAPCSNGQSGNVWFLLGGPPAVDCTIPAGTALFFPIVNVECSSLEPFPFHGDTPQQRQDCAKAWIDNVTDLAATIDGNAVVNLTRLRTRSGDFSFTVPYDNIYGLLPAPAWGFSSGDGYYILLAPLSAGLHRIHVKGTFHDPFDLAHPVTFPLSTELTLHVLP